MIIKPPDELKEQEWRLLSADARLEYLQDFEDSLAASENRSPALLRPIFGGELNPDGQPVLRGLCYTERGRECIGIAAPLLRADAPYQGVETYLHEARHAYQKAAVANPSLHNDPAQVDAWANNQIDKDAYIGYEESPLHYRGQPVELDANSTARQRMDEIYAGHFTEQAGYDKHSQLKEQVASQFTEAAEHALGTDFAEKIEQETRDRTRKFEIEQQQTAEANNEVTSERKRNIGYGM